MKDRISFKSWGFSDCKEIFLFKIENRDGNYVEISNYGATVVSIVVPSRANVLEHVVLGFTDLQGYLEDDSYIGSTIGRFANRISGASFRIDEKEYHLESNDNNNSNHGGYSGFNNKVFDFKLDKKNGLLSLSLYSPDLEGGFPGNLTLTVSFEWTDNNELTIHYTANSDKKTHLNFTNHCYFNLTGNSMNLINHRLTVDSDLILEVDNDYIPTGKILEAKKMKFQNTKLRRNLNHYYILENSSCKNKKQVAELYDSQSGRSLEIYTSYPGLMLYTGDFLRSSFPGHYGRNYKSFDGVCLECQYYPDTPNQLGFPSTILYPGELYDEYISYQFGIIK